MVSLSPGSSDQQQLHKDACSVGRPTSWPACTSVDNMYLISMANTALSIPQ